MLEHFENDQSVTFGHQLFAHCFEILPSAGLDFWRQPRGCEKFSILLFGSKTSRTAESSLCPALARVYLHHFAPTTSAARVCVCVCVGSFVIQQIQTAEIGRGKGEQEEEEGDCV